MADNEESSFTFVDKRHNLQDDSVKPDDTSPITSDPVQNSEEREDRVETMDYGDDAPRKSMSMTDHLITCIELLHQGAWISMGLVSDPVSGEINRDLEGARVAIDTIEFIAGKVEAKLDPPMQRELKNLLTDLRLNYVQQMNR